MYPEPKHRLVIEPFCGAAHYARRHCRGHEVWLNDIDPTIYGVWRYLQSASRERVETVFQEELYPQGMDVREIPGLCQEERDMLGFICRLGANRPANVRSRWSTARNRIDNMRNQILDILDVLPSWRITNLAHDQLPDVSACWFVDPPYRHARTRYRYDLASHYANPDVWYATLADWCKSRKGQTIVCEGPGADWLPFEGLGNFLSVNGLLLEERVWMKDG